MRLAFFILSQDAIWSFMITRNKPVQPIIETLYAESDGGADRMLKQLIKLTNSVLIAFLVL